MVATFGGLAGFSRYMRQSMLEVIRQDYIQTARAKGLSEGTIIGKHALRNALLPVVTVLGLSLPTLIGGSVIIESIFAIPGMGQLTTLSALQGDIPMVMGAVLVTIIVVIVVNFFGDLALTVLNPKARTR